jgi:hypothetical protein
MLLKSHENITTKLCSEEEETSRVFGFVVFARFFG